jgi:hypothetical protein
VRTFIFPTTNEGIPLNFVQSDLISIKMIMKSVLGAEKWLGPLYLTMAWVEIVGI